MVSIYDVALRRLSTRSRTVAEMKTYLKEKDFAADEISSLIEEFCAYGYLDEERYCREYFRYAFGKGKGQRKVFAELKGKGVDGQVITQVFADFSEEEAELCDEKSRAEQETAKVLRLAGLAEGEPVPQNVKGRIARKLQSKGYGSETIYRILGELPG